MPVTKNESANSRLIANEPEKVQIAIQEIKELKKVVTPNAVINIVRKAEKIKDIEQQKADIKAEIMPDIDKLYDILVLDPPWNYGRKYDPETSRVANPYPEMTIDEIINIDLPLKDNSIVWLWTTQQFLPDAFDILKAWGLDYKAIMVWNKEKMGMGYWLRMQCEFCLLAVKGKPIWDIKDLRDIITEPRREHSRKPEIFYNMINDKFSYASKLEYFSRIEREGWDVYGNDITKF